MTEVFQGPGLWLASDGQWYPPHLHPSYQPPPCGPPLWWLASDGKWYPPETHPLHTSQLQLTIPDPSIDTLSDAQGSTSPQQTNRDYAAPRVIPPETRESGQELGKRASTRDGLLGPITRFPQWLVLLVGLVVLMVIVGAVAGSGDGRHPPHANTTSTKTERHAATSATSTASSTTSSSAPTTSRVSISSATTMTTAAPSMTTTTTIPLAVRLSSWWAGVKADDAQLQVTLTALATATTSGTGVKVNSACASLDIGAQKLQRDAPAPTPAINTPWQAALTDYVTAGSLCESSIHGITISTPEMGRASAYLNRGDSESAQVIGEIKRIVPGA